MPVRTLLCYGDSNTHGTPPMADPFAISRLSWEQRWPGVVQRLLGESWRVIEEGLPGRTTVFHDPVEGAHLNGLAHLEACLNSHRPIDLLAVMLGTNDLKPRFNASPADIAGGVGALLERARRCEVGVEYGPPALLLIAPVPIEEIGWMGEFFAGGAAKSRALATRYRAVAERLGAAFLDAGLHAKVDPTEGVHFGAAEHATLGAAVATEVRTWAASDHAALHPPRSAP